MVIQQDRTEKSRINVQHDDLIKPRKIIMKCKNCGKQNYNLYDDYCIDCFNKNLGKIK